MVILLSHEASRGTREKQIPTPHHVFLEDPDRGHTKNKKNALKKQVVFRKIRPEISPQLVCFFILMTFLHMQECGVASSCCRAPQHLGRMRYPSTNSLVAFRMWGLHSDGTTEARSQ